MTKMSFELFIIRITLNWFFKLRFKKILLCHYDPFDWLYIMLQPARFILPSSLSLFNRKDIFMEISRGKISSIYYYSLKPWLRNLDDALLMFRIEHSNALLTFLLDVHLNRILAHWLLVLYDCSSQYAIRCTQLFNTTMFNETQKALLGASSALNLIPGSYCDLRFAASKIQEMPMQRYFVYI